MTASWSAVLDVWEADLAVRRQLAEAATPGPWVTERRRVLVDRSVRGWKHVADCYDEPDASQADAAFIARHDPASVLADIATQQATITMLRGVLAAHFECEWITRTGLRVDHCCYECSNHDPDGPASWPCEALAAAVAVIDTIRTTQETR